MFKTSFVMGILLAFCKDQTKYVTFLVKTNDQKPTKTAIIKNKLAEFYEILRYYLIFFF